MGKESDYNKDLRSNILIASIRVEEAASNVLKFLFRTIKPDSKTLGNKSSSLSFKNKIDLLYDLEDIEKSDYIDMIKFMEIRNQFIHNPNCNSFEDLTKDFPEGVKYLKAKYPNTEESEELMNQISFINLWKSVLVKLILLKIEYNKGAQEEMQRFVDSMSLKKLDEIYISSFEAWKKAFQSKELPFLGYSSEELEYEVSDFYRKLQYNLLDEQIKILDSISANEVTSREIYKRRVILKK